MPDGADGDAGSGSIDIRKTAKTMLTSTVDEILSEIAAGRPDACLVDWAESSDLFGNTANDPAATIRAAQAEFQKDGWVWYGQDLVKGDWHVWFRGQGALSRPICQWSRRKA